MEVLSNKEIYVLLKILNNKRIKSGSLSAIEIDKYFTIDELKHLQQEISLCESKSSNEVLTIENTYRSMFGENLHSGYKLHVINFQSIVNYAHRYVQELAQGNLSGLTDENSLSKLVNEFYSATKDSTNLDYYITNEMKYMPVILSAYTSNLVELKTITNTKYDIRRDLSEDILFDDLSFTKSLNDTVKITIEMNMTDFCQRMAGCINSGNNEISIDISAIFGNATIINLEDKKKITKKGTVPKKRYHDTYHMKRQQWLLFMCILKVIKEPDFQEYCTGVPKEFFINNGILTENKKQNDMAIRRLNEYYNTIMQHKEKDFVDIIFPQVDDRYYEIDTLRFLNFCKVISNNEHLSNEFNKYHNFYNMIIK